MAGLTIDERRRRLARLLVGFGANVQPGQTVMVGGDIDDRELVRAVANECYLAGARFVELNYFDLHLKRARIEFGGDDSIGYATTWSYEQARAAAAERWAIISLSGGTDPSILAGLDPDRLGRDNSPVNTEWLKAVSEQLVNWTVGPSPIAGLGGGRASRHGAGRSAGAALGGGRARLPAGRGGPGRVVGAAHGRAWSRRPAASPTTVSTRCTSRGPAPTSRSACCPSSRLRVRRRSRRSAGIQHRPNVPSEEVVHDARPERVDGRCARPSRWTLGGTVLTRAARALRGRPCGRRSTPTRAPTCCARCTAIDDGGVRLGEVALVDGESRIGQLGTVFYETLLDENAASHIALGQGFDYCVSGDDVERINASQIHIDFMIGDDDVDVTGVTGSGDRVPVLRGGAWQI